MKHIDAKTTELTHREGVAKAFHSELLDIGFSVIDATLALEKFGRRTTPYAPEFLLWLNDGVPLDLNRDRDPRPAIF